MGSWSYAVTLPSAVESTAERGLWSTVYRCLPLYHLGPLRNRCGDGVRSVKGCVFCGVGGSPGNDKRKREQDEKSL